MGKWGDIAEGFAPAPRKVPMAAAVPAFTPQLQWSEQQSQVFSAPAPLLIEAFAGAGKTAVLFEYARRQGGQWLYLSYNKSLADAAERTAQFLGVRAQTLHSLAFARYGASLRHKLGKELDLRHLRDLLGPTALFSARPGLLYEGLNRFMASADAALSGAHAPKDLPEEEKAAWLTEAGRLWQAMLDPASPIPTPHDAYLKLFLLDPAPWPGRGLLVDEVQDLTPALQSALTHQAQSKPIVYAGDRYQQIYGFRGASTGVWQQGLPRQLLSESRRFGPEIAALATQFLQAMGESRPLIGKGPSGTVKVALEPSPGAVALAPMHHELRAIAAQCQKAGISVWAQGSLAAELGISSVAQPGAVRLSTVHAVKGETLERVWLAPGISRGILGDFDPLQAHRLAYVALTRAQRELSYHPEALSLLSPASTLQAAPAEELFGGEWLL